MQSSPGDRSVVLLGCLLLSAAGIWLVTLRRPVPAAASGAAPQLHVRSWERTPARGERYVGVVVAGRDAQLRAELAAEVVAVFAAPGERVRRGTALLQLRAWSAQGARSAAAAQVAEDRASQQAARLSLAEARDKADRMQRAPSAYPAREIEAARMQAQRAAAELARARASAALHRADRDRELARADKQLVRAPFDGVLSARQVDVGDRVSEGDALGRLVDDARFVRFAVPADAQARLRVGDRVRAWLTPAEALNAEIVDVAPELDPAALLGFARARLEVETKAAPAPGVRVEVELEQDAAAAAAHSQRGVR